MPFSSLVHMHTNHHLLKITELEYSQCAYMEAKRGELALPSIHHWLGVWTDAWVSDFLANTVDIYWGSLWGQTFAALWLIDGKLQFKYTLAAKTVTHTHTCTQTHTPTHPHTYAHTHMHRHMHTQEHTAQCYFYNYTIGLTQCPSFWFCVRTSLHAA